jgi:hypothetical protein
MKSAPLGTNTLAVEVTNISTHGFWLLVAEEELFLPFEKFPCFRDAPVASILAVGQPGPDHIYWPRPDVDLSLNPFASRTSSLSSRGRAFDMPFEQAALLSRPRHQGSSTTGNRGQSHGRAGVCSSTPFCWTAWRNQA